MIEAREAKNQPIFLTSFSHLLEKHYLELKKIHTFGGSPEEFVNFTLNGVNITPQTIKVIIAALHLSGLPDDRKAEYLAKAF